MSSTTLDGIGMPSRMGFLRGLRTRLGLRKERPRTVDFLSTAKHADHEPLLGIEIGRKTYGVGKATLIGYYPNDNPLSVGSFCSIADEVVFFFRTDHRPDLVSTYPGYSIASTGDLFDDSVFKGPTVVGHDVWIGYRAMIMPGVSIGNGAVVAAGSVVTKDIPPYAIVAGNPAKLVRMRFDPDTVSVLQAVQWWNWSPGKIRANIDLFRLPGPEFATRIEETSNQSTQPASAP
ncbi:acetyltransferase-like isoleucine patch superfamily enzyme [Aminobacter lissarensis]|uniref:Acetyltransferase-like isoleucine patch superfamily enzyme n=1 Tax=Aminobacter carboxidus TaxID=376165 RepID=A0A8E2BGM3_9HYPH|nr:CatB-related O-acetyltransferase [Aminobacter lissarensis]MBB6469600.1 acetyltransferase-like isoleucine patch superfamily enzyme [Aminobacter lissarensis]